MLRPPSNGGRGESDFRDYDDAAIPAKRGPVVDPDRQGDNQQGDDLPERLGERIENGSTSSIAPGGSDLLPDVEPPETTM